MQLERPKIRGHPVRSEGGTMQLALNRGGRGDRGDKIVRWERGCSAVSQISDSFPSALSLRQ